MVFCLFCVFLQVRDLVERCTCPTQFPMIRVSEGKYRIGDTKVLIFVRVSIVTFWSFYYLSFQGEKWLKNHSKRSTGDPQKAGKNGQGEGQDKNERLDPRY